MLERHCSRVEKTGLLRRAFTSAAFALLLAAPFPAAAQSFSLEDALDIAFPSSLIAAPNGQGVAWITNLHGSRNIWVASPDASGAGLNARAVTSFTGDDGIGMGEVAWSADARTVLFTRGGSFEGGGPTNVAHNLTPSRSEVWAVSADGANARVLAPGRAAIVSPRGDLVAYLADGQIWTVPLNGGRNAEALFRDPGRSTSLAWAPDGQRLAFVSARRDHSMLGVFDFSTRRVTWFAASFDNDSQPVWSPNGERIAFVRIPAGTGYNFSARRSGEPWSIWTLDPRSGEARQVWRAEAGRGSVFRGLEDGPVLSWASDDRLVFPWERDGWSRLYSIPITGGHPTVLSPPDSEVLSYAVTQDGGDVVFSSNSGEFDRRHLWQTSVSGGAPRQLTNGAVIDDTPQIVAGGRTVFLRADARTPTQLAMLDAGGAVSFPTNRPLSAAHASFVEPQAVQFAAPDGVTAYGQVFVPANLQAGERRPAILFFHGGPIRQMLVGWHPMEAYSLMYAMNQYLVSKGYIVLSVNYRGGTGYGMEFREAERFGPTGASELGDINGALNYLRRRGDVDMNRIGAYGGSYGGLMTALSLAFLSDRVAAGVDYAGVYDWSTMLAGWDEDGMSDEEQRLARASSPIGAIDRWRSPVLVVHADDDRAVPFSQSVTMVRALRERSVPYEQLVLPGELHDLMMHRSWLQFFTATEDFLNRHLLNQPEHATRRRFSEAEN